MARKPAAGRCLPARAGRGQGRGPERTLHAPRLHRPLGPRREPVPVPVPRQPIRRRRQRAAWSGSPATGSAPRHQARGGCVRRGMKAKVTRYLDERTGLGPVIRYVLDRRIPTGISWLHTFGSASLTLFVLMVVTGMFLALNYAPSLGDADSR